MYMKMATFESMKRSLVKACTFRSLILVSDTVIVFTITHRYDVTFGVLIFSNLASTILYFLHERLWNGIVCGKDKKKPEFVLETPSDTLK